MTKVPVHKRNFGIVFQSYALFPHLSVYDNVAFGFAKIRKLDKAEMDKKVKNILRCADSRNSRAVFHSRCPADSGRESLLPGRW